MDREIVACDVVVACNVGGEFDDLAAIRVIRGHIREVRAGADPSHIYGGD